MCSAICAVTQCPTYQPPEPPTYIDCEQCGNGVEFEISDQLECNSCQRTLCSDCHEWYDEDCEKCFEKKPIQKGVNQ